MRPRLLLTIGELALGLIIGAIAYLAAGERDAVAGLLSVAVGLLTSLLAATLSLRFEQSEQQRRSGERFDHLVTHVADRLLTNADAASVLRFGGVEVPRSEVTRVWLDRVWRTSTRYWGVIYTAPDEVVDTNIFKLGVAVLSAKVRVDHVDVRRLFVVDTAAELDHLMPTLRSLQDNQIKVRYMLRATLDGKSLIRTQVDELPTLDFALIDGLVVWNLLLDGSRRIRAGSLHFDERMNAKYSEVFRMLWDASSALTEVPPSADARVKV